MRWTDDAIDQLYENIGSKIKEARQLRGVTQSELAKRLQLTRSSVANIEAGRQRVMIHWVMQIAEELDMPLLRLLVPPRDPDMSGLVAELDGQPESTFEFVKSALRQAD